MAPIKAESIVDAMPKALNPVSFEVVGSLPDARGALRECDEAKKEGELRLYKLEGILSWFKARQPVNPRMNRFISVVEGIVGWA